MTGMRRLDLEQPLVTYTEATALPALVGEAHLAIVACELCGAAVVLDQRDSVDRRAQHATWHALDLLRHERPRSTA